MTFHVILNWLATTKSFQRWLRKKHMLTWVQSPPFLVCGFDVLLKSLYSWFAKFMWTINNVNTTVILPFVHGWNFKLCTAQKKKPYTFDLLQTTYLPLFSSTWIKQTFTSPKQTPWNQPNSTQRPQVVKPYGNPSFTKTFGYQKCRYEAL